MSVERRVTPQLGRTVELRDNNSDKQMWEDAFVTGYHIPPADMPNPKIVLDLGANIGLTAAHYQAIWPQAYVWMVEPSPENMALAQRNAPRCPPLLCAVARDSGWRFLNEEGKTASAFSLGEKGRKVYALGMWQLVEILGDEIDFVKMDIEGMEWEILESLYGVRHLLVEFHGSEESERILNRGLEILTRYGWKARPHPPHPQAVYATK